MARRMVFFCTVASSVRGEARAKLYPKRLEGRKRAARLSAGALPLPRQEAQPGGEVAQGGFGGAAGRRVGQGAVGDALDARPADPRIRCRGDAHLRSAAPASSPGSRASRLGPKSRPSLVGELLSWARRATWLAQEPTFSREESLFPGAESYLGGRKEHLGCYRELLR